MKHSDPEVIFKPGLINISQQSGCFMTPQYLLNLIRWDMCSSRGKTELSAKDMKVLGVKQADALAFFALQSTKPEFMLTKEACPSHKQVCSKTIHDGAPIKLIPSFANFGSSSDSGTLHYRFKESLRQVTEAQKLYISDRLENLADRVVRMLLFSYLTTPQGLSRRCWSSWRIFISHAMTLSELLLKPGSWYVIAWKNYSPSK